MSETVGSEATIDDHRRDADYATAKKRLLEIERNAEEVADLLQTGGFPAAGVETIQRHARQTREGLSREDFERGEDRE